MSAVTELTELRLIQWAFQGPLMGPRLWRQLDLPSPPVVRFSVVEPFVVGRQKPGDIDVLICASHQPEQAVAFECKRVKIKPEAFETLQVGKLAGLAESIHQIRGLQEIGFSRCFLLVFVAVDGRERHQFNFVGGGPTPALIRSVDESLRCLSIHSDVGIVSIELVQPTTRDFEDAGGAGIRVLRAASKQAQPPSLTKRLTEYLSGRTA